MRFYKVQHQYKCPACGAETDTRVSVSGPVTASDKLRLAQCTYCWHMGNLDTFKKHLNK